MDWLTDQPTDGRTKRGLESRDAIKNQESLSTISQLEKNVHWRSQTLQQQLSKLICWAGKCLPLHVWRQN